MTRAECILAAVTLELGRQESALEKARGIKQVLLCVKFDKHGKVLSVQANTGTENDARGIEENAV